MPRTSPSHSENPGLVRVTTSPAFGGLFSHQEDNDEPSPDRCTHERLQQGVRPRYGSRPDHEREYQQEDEAPWSEEQQSCCCGVTGDGTVCARFPAKCDQG